MGRYFRIEKTEDPGKLMSLYNLRYQVYCEERGFIPKQLCPGQLEIDEYDDVSLHFAAYYNADQEATGTVRLIKGEFLEQLPLCNKCRIDRSLLPEDFKPESCAEISRLAISKRLRRRATDGYYPNEKPDNRSTGSLPNKRARFPEIVEGLYRALYRETKRHKIEYWLAAMEPSLVKLLKRLYVGFREIGPEAEYYGVVKPYIASVSEFESSLCAEDPELYASFESALV